MPSRRSKRKRPSPAIDPSELGPSSAARLKPSSISNNNDVKDQADSNHSLKRMFARKDRAVLSWTPREMMSPEGTALGGDSGIGDYSSRAAAKPASESSTMQTGSFLPVQNAIVDGKTPAKSIETIGDSEAQQQPRTVTPPGLQVGDTKKGSKVGSTQQVMPNRNICVPLVPVPPVCSSTLEDVQSVSLPDFRKLINYNYSCKRASEEGNKTCVMCGMTHQYLLKKSDHKDNLPFILRSRSGLCSVCQDVVWVVVESNIEIRFCFKCKAFHPWAAFRKGDKMLKSCHSCLSGGKTERPSRSTGTGAGERKARASTGASAAILPSNAIRCVVLPQPVNLPPPSAHVASDNSTLPDFGLIVNYPAFRRQKPDNNGNKCCVMCSKSLPYLLRSNQNGSDHFIPVDNNGICTVCEAAVWQLLVLHGLPLKTGVRIKWCNGCRHFLPWASYQGDGNNVTQICSHCRQKRSSVVAVAGGVADTTVTPASESSLN